MRSDLFITRHGADASISHRRSPLDESRRKRSAEVVQAHQRGDQPVDAKDLSVRRGRRDLPEGARLDTLSDGRAVLVYGDTRRAAAFNHAPGMNELGYLQTRGIVECELVLRHAGIHRSEAVLVNAAVNAGLCEARTKQTDSGMVVDAPISGGTTLKQRADLLQQEGLSTSIKRNATIEDLAEWIKTKKTAIIPINRAGTNESVIVVGVAYEKQNPQEIAGFLLLKAGEGDVQFLDSASLRNNWQAAKQGLAVLVDTANSSEATRTIHAERLSVNVVSPALLERIDGLQQLEPLQQTWLKQEAGQKKEAHTHEVIDRLECSGMPCFRGKLSDGRAVVVIGDVHAAAVGHHYQGQNDLGYGGTCGIVGVESLLRQLGIQTSEKELVQFADAHNLCATKRTEKNPAWHGGTTYLNRQELLQRSGVKDVQHADATSHTSEELARLVEQGNGVLISGNAGLLYENPDFYQMGNANHVLHVTGVMRDEQTSQLLGFFVNDGNRVPGGTFVSRERMTLIFEEAQGTSLAHTRLPLSTEFAP